MAGIEALKKGGALFGSKKGARVKVGSFQKGVSKDKKINIQRQS